MITVKLWKQNNSIQRFTVSGHAMQAEAGHDIVCASVSSVVWMVVNGLENVAGLPVTYQAKDGFVECRLPAQGAEKGQILLRSMEQFLRSLEEQYSAYISVQEV